MKICVITLTCLGLMCACFVNTADARLFGRLFRRNCSGGSCSYSNSYKASYQQIQKTDPQVQKGLAQIEKRNRDVRLDKFAEYLAAAEANETNPNASAMNFGFPVASVLHNVYVSKRKPTIGTVRAAWFADVEKRKKQYSYTTSVGWGAARTADGHFVFVEVYGNDTSLQTVFK